MSPTCDFYLFIHFCIVCVVHLHIIKLGYGLFILRSSRLGLGGWFAIHMKIPRIIQPKLVRENATILLRMLCIRMLNQLFHLLFEVRSGIN